MQHQQIVKYGDKIGIISIVGSQGTYCWDTTVKGDRSYAANVARGERGYLLLPDGKQVSIVGGDSLTRAEALEWYAENESSCSDRFKECFRRYLAYEKAGFFNDDTRKRLISNYGG